MGRHVSGSAGGSGEGISRIRPPRAVHFPAWKGGEGVETHGHPKRFPVLASPSTRMFELSGTSMSLRDTASGNALATTTVAASNALSGVHCYDIDANVLHWIVVEADNRIAIQTINCANGAISAVVRSAVVATPANWGSASMFATKSGQNINVFTSGFRHTLNAATGAIVSQNNRHTLANGDAVWEFPTTGQSGPDKGITYLTAANDAAVRLYGGRMNFQRADVLCGDLAAAPDVTAAGWPLAAASEIQRTRFVALGDVVAFVNFHSGNPGSLMGWRFYDAVDFDRWVHEVIDNVIGGVR